MGNFMKRPKYKVRNLVETSQVERGDKRNTSQNWMKSGHKIIPFSDEEQADQNLHFEGHKYGVVRLIPGNIILYKSFERVADAIYNFNVKPTDVFIITFAKCGTTWMQEIVWTMRNNPNLNNPMASMGINARCPFLELDHIAPLEEIEKLGPDNDLMKIFGHMCPGKDPKDGIFVQLAEASPEPRTIKSHLPFSLLPPNLLDTCKVVYVARNPKDVCVSYHHHCRIMKAHGYVGEFPKFADYFVKDELPYSPYGSHLKSAWNLRDHKNLHFTFYEDIKTNPEEEIKNLNEFLETKLDNQQIKNVVNYTSFEAMKSRDNLIGGDAAKTMMNWDIMETEGGFFRKGESGSYKAKLTPDLEKKIDEWTRKNMEGIPFKYS